MMTPDRIHRRTFLQHAGAASALGGMGLFERLSLAASLNGGHPLAPRLGHFPAKAKHLILFFMTGGISHVDTFDHKPKLQEDHGKTVGKRDAIKASTYAFKPYGASGKMVSELFANVGSVVDDICFLHSIYGDSSGHSAATLGMHTGSFTIPMPSIGSWISYGLGTENTNLPSFVVLAAKDPYQGFIVWDANFLPAFHKGVRLIPGADPLPNLKNPVESVSRRELETLMLHDLNEAHLIARPGDTNLAASMNCFDTARGLMREAPDVFDIRREPEHILQLYGTTAEDRSSFGAQCLTARRLVERGVRVVELFDVGSNHNWDSHDDMAGHAKLAKNIDKPLAGLIKDLKQRGLLDETLIVGCTEFGRTPWQDAPDHPKGRGHHASAFTCFLAGGGVKAGLSYGRSDDIGNKVAEKPMHIHDFHATILHLMGLDHTRLTYRYSGRDFRLTDVKGNVAHDVIA